MKVQDYYSTSSSASAFDYFNVLIKYECDDDIVTLTSDIGMFVYSTVSGTPSTIPANFAQTITGGAGCEMIIKAEAYSSTTLIWTDITTSGPGEFSWRTGFAAGAITVQTATAYSPYKDYPIRVTYTSKYS